MGELKEIGNLVNIPPRIDPSFRMTDYIRASMLVIDLIPVIQTVNVLKLAEDGHGVVFDFQKPREEFQKACKSYGLDSTYHGLRLWCTDETTIQDSFTNQFETNFLESTINRVVDTNNRFINLTRSLGKSEETAGKIRDLVANTLKGMASSIPVVGDTLSDMISTVTDVALKGKQFSLPKIWTQSDYNPAITLNTKLISPYGSPKAVAKFVIEPLAYLLILLSAKSEDGVSFGFPTSIYVKAYGIASLRAGYIESVSIQRGGNNLTYNQYRQPLSLNISVSIRPMTQGFAAIVSDSVDYDVKNNDTNSANEDTDVIQFNQHKTLNTVSDIIESLKPFQYSSGKQLNLQTAYNSRQSILNSSTFTEVGSEGQVGQIQPTTYAGEVHSNIPDIVNDSIGDIEFV